MRESLIKEIIGLEWGMFSSVSNVGGPAACQMDSGTFRIMRRGNMAGWSEALLESWLGDLKEAEREGRNLMSEKYARMMETTFPEEYAALAGQLPAVAPDALEMIEEIVAVNVEWRLGMAGRYPKLCGQGRTTRTSEDSRYETSFETYLRCELRTYSPKTIRLLRAHTQQQRQAGLNGVEAAILAEVGEYGFASLEEAEKAQGN